MRCKSSGAVHCAVGVSGMLEEGRSHTWISPAALLPLVKNTCVILHGYGPIQISTTCCLAEPCTAAHGFLSLLGSNPNMGICASAVAFRTCTWQSQRPLCLMKLFQKRSMSGVSSKRDTRSSTGLSSTYCCCADMTRRTAAADHVQTAQSISCSRRSCRTMSRCMC